MPRTTFGPSTRSQSSCNSPIGCCFRPGDTRPPGAGTSCAGESGGQRTFSIAIAVAFLGRPRAAPINRHSPDSGQFLGQSHLLDRLGQRQIGLVGGKRRSKPAVDGTATLIRTVLPESRHASPLVARAFDLPGSSSRRGWCSQPGDQGQDFGEHPSRDCDLGHLEGHGSRCLLALFRDPAGNAGNVTPSPCWIPMVSPPCGCPCFPDHREMRRSADGLTLPRIVRARRRVIVGNDECRLERPV